MSELIEELKRLHAGSKSNDREAPQDSAEFFMAIYTAFPAIVARLEAAERLLTMCNALESGADVDSQAYRLVLEAANAAFDKEPE